MKPWSMAVKAVIWDDAGRFLLIRRSASSTHSPKCWEWPGGKMDPGEDFATAVLRETREETGLDVEITGLAGATTFETSKVNVVLLCMEARIVGGTIALSDEHDALEWVAPADLAHRSLFQGVEKFMIEYASRSGRN